MFHVCSLSLSLLIHDQPECHEKPVVKELLPSLQLPALILQCFQLEPTTPSLLHQVSASLSQLPLLPHWQDSLVTSVSEDPFSLLTTARVLLAILLELCITKDVCTIIEKTYIVCAVTESA